MTDTVDGEAVPGQTALAIIYGITAFPVGAWALICVYALMRQRYDGTTREAEILTIATGALPVIAWILFVVVSWVLSRRASLLPVWRVWAVVSAIPLLLFSVYLAVAIGWTAVAAFTPHEQMPAPVRPAVPPTTVPRGNE